MRSVYVLLLSSCLVSSGLAKPAAPILAYQDSLGQYSFGYSAPGSARSEIRTLNGETRGAYSYIDDAGVIQTTQYTADGENGFRVAATNLPQAPLPVLDTQDIVVAKAAPLETQEMKQEEGKVGEKNIFLQELRPSEKQAMELNEKTQSQTKQAENISQDAKEVMKMEEKENLEEKLKSASEMETKAESSQNENSEAPRGSNNQMMPQLLKQSTVPIFRVSQGSLLIDPSAIQGPINVEGSSITPASTTLKINQEPVKSAESSPDAKELPAPMEEEAKPQEQEKPIDLPKEIITPYNILPLNAAYPALIRYTAVPSLHYVVYNSA